MTPTGSRFRGPDGRVRAGWRILLIAIPAFVAVQAASIGLGLALPEPWSFLVAGVAMLAAAIIVVALLAPRVDRRPFRGYGLHVTGSWWRDLAVGLAIGFAIPAIAFVLLLATGQARVTETFSAGERVGLWAALVPLLVYWTAVAFWEELVFRGVMLKNAAEGLSGRFDPATATFAAVAITTVIFAAGHANQFLLTDTPPLLAAVLWVVLGIVLALAYVLTGSLAAPIGIHFAVNFGLNNVFGIPAELGEEFPTVFRLETLGDPSIAGPGGLITILAALAGLALLLAWSRLRGDASTHLGATAAAPAPTHDRSEQQLARHATEGARVTRFREQQHLPRPLRFLTVTTEVDDDCLHVQLSSLLSPLSQHLPTRRIQQVETHEDLSKHIPGTLRYWLMGVQIVPRIGWAINPGSPRGVTVRRDDGWRLVIGSRRPDELAAALRGAASGAARPTK